MSLTETPPKPTARYVRLCVPTSWRHIGYHRVRFNTKEEAARELRRKIQAILNPAD